MTTSTDIRVDPEALEQVPAGPGLAAALASLDSAGVDASDRVLLLEARQRMVSSWEAQLYADMAAIATGYEALGHEDWPEETSPEIACALRLTRRGADAELGVAIALRDRLPEVAELFAQGVLDRRRVKVLITDTSHLNEELAREVVARVLPQATEWTTGQLAHRLRKLCLEVDPDAAAKRYDRTVADRRVTAGINPNGAMDIWAWDLPSDRAAAAMDHVNKVARSLKRDGETRTMDQLRADVLLDLLSGIGHYDGGRGGSVSLTVDLATLAGLSDRAGELGGYGPVISDVARQIAANSPRATWEWAAYCTGCRALTDAGTTRRRPRAAEHRRVRKRDRCCAFPGCRRPADECDLDHMCDWIKTGRTSVCRLAVLCRYHHLRKHRAGWTYQRLPDGAYRWRSPLGHIYLRPRDPP